MLSLNSIVYEGISRIYRNTIVSHIRNSLTTAYPDDWLDHLKKPFTRDEWERIDSHAGLRRNTGELGTFLKDDFDLLDVNHFYNLFDCYFDIVIPKSSLKTSDPYTYKQIKQNILGWSRQIKNMRDPVLGHPGQEDVSVPDAYVTLDSARRLLTFIDPEAAQTIEKLRDELDGHITTVEDISIEERREVEASTLPSRESVAPRFVGRRHELEQLNSWLTDQDGRLWLLAGDGGKGKTAIAYQFATEVRNDPPDQLDILIWLSAKKRQFVSGRTVNIESPDFFDLSSALDWILAAYGVIDIATMGINEKKRQCLEYLSDFPALVILDDADSLDDSAQTISFFIQNIRLTSSKLLLTSRRVPTFFGPAVTQVKGLNEMDGPDFIRSRIDIYKLDVNLFTKKHLSRILTICDGSPLFIQDLLRLCKVGEKPSRAIDIWKKNKGHAARKYALQREYEELTYTAQVSLLVCALFEGYISLDEISFVADLAEDDCRDAIDELQGLFLVPEPRLVRDVPRFKLNINTQRLVYEVYGGTDLARRLTAIIRTLKGKSPSTHEFRELILRYRQRADTSVRRGDYTAAEKILLDALKRYPQSSELYGKLGWTYKSWQPHQRYTDAQHAFKRAADLRSSNEDMYWQWWFMEQQRSEWTAAADAAEQGLTLVPHSISLLFGAGYARSQLAREYLYIRPDRAEQQARKAEKYLNYARDVATKDRSDIRVNHFYGRLYRAMALNYGRLIYVNQAHGHQSRSEHYQRLVVGVIKDWSEEDPNDPYLETEKRSLLRRVPSLVSVLGVET